MAENNNQDSDHRPPASDLRSLPSALRSPTSELCSPNPSAPRLPAPVRITEQVWPEGTVPVVSVFCITYNHVNFIRDAIEGFLMQETTFPVEIFIHDDASTDGTADIVKEYAEKYPKLFWTVLQTKNQWSKGNPNVYFLELMQKQSGEFLALCEGDDYWISKKKLEKQVEVLTNQNYSGVFHQVAWVTEKKTLICSAPEEKNRRDVIFSDIMSSDVFISTGSFLFRKNVLKKDCFDLLKNCQIGDWPLFAYVANDSKIAFIDNEMACYRKHEKGVWSSLSEINGLHVKCRTLENFVKFFGLKKTEIAIAEIKKIKLSMINIYINNNNILKSFAIFCKMTITSSSLLDLLSTTKQYFKMLIN